MTEVKQTGGVALKPYMGPVTQMPNGTCGWMTPNRLRRDGDHLFIQRDTNIVSEMVADLTLKVVKTDGEVVVFDDEVFSSDRWWNRNHTDTYSFPYDYGVYVRDLRRGPEKHRANTNGRVRGTSPWTTANLAVYSGAPHSMPIGHYGFVPASALGGDATNRSIYLKGGTVVLPSIEDDATLLVARHRDGIFVYDGDVPEQQRWWNSAQANGYSAFHDKGPTYVKHLVRHVGQGNG